MTTRSLPWRLLPPIGRVRAVHVLERNVLVYRRQWRIIFTGFFEPVFYLFAIGIGVGKLVGELALADGTLISYTAFVAPGLLAASAMNGAVMESTFNIFFKLRYDKVYDVMLSTPMRPMDVALGEITWSLGRGAIYTVGFVTVMAAFGLITSWWAILVVPAALLLGFCFAGIGMTATTFVRSWQDFDLITLATQPIFLFSATFFPIDVYPPFLQKVVAFSPLYHGVEIIRGLTLGRPSWDMLGHAAVLLIVGIIGLTIASRRIEKTLLV